MSIASITAVPRLSTSSITSPTPSHTSSSLPSLTMPTPTPTPPPPHSHLSTQSPHSTPSLKQHLPTPDPPQVPLLLRQLLSPLRTKWVVDFLFTESPIHTSHLSASDIHQKSVLRSISTSRTEPPHLRQHRPYASEESSHLEGRLLYSPVITIDSITLGFGIMDAVCTMGCQHEKDRGELPAKSISTHFRCVRDGNLGVLLEVHDLPEQDSVVMRCIRVESTTISRIFKARFNRTQLLQVVRTTQQNHAYFEKALHSLESFETELQHRVCPICSAGANTPCDCRYKVPSSTHIFDHSPFLAAMKYIIGTFEGVASKVRFNQGNLAGYTVLGSRTKIDALQDAVTMNRMISWATTDLNRSTSQSAGAFHLFTDCRLGSPFDDSTQPSTLLSYTEDFADDPDADDTQLLESLERQVLYGSCTTDLALHDHFPDQTAAAVPASAPVAAPVPSPTPASADLNLKELGLPGLDIMQSHKRHDFSFHDRDIMDVDLGRIGVCDLEAQDTGSSGLEMEMDGANNAFSELDFAQNDSSGSGTPERASSAIMSLQGSVDEKALKKEIRKQKNRESALRSNRRKRAMRDALEKDLKECHKKVEQLRNRETVLRKENMRLRRCFLVESG